MKLTDAPDHNRAAIMLYSMVALNTQSKSGYTINRIEAAQVLARLLQIDSRAPHSWLRGDFKKHPLSQSHFLKIVQTYRTKPGLESAREITALAIYLYGLDHHQVLETLGSTDRKLMPKNEKQFDERQSEKKELAKVIFDLIDSSSPEEVKGALMKLMDQRLDHDFHHEQKTNAP